MNSGPTVYLDHAATSPLRAVAASAMAPFESDVFANPTGSHASSRAARKAVDESRDEIAAILGVSPGEIVFTSGGTESDNTVVLGAVRRNGGVAVAPATEHHAVLHPVEHLGGQVVDVCRDGLVDTSALEAALRANDVSVVSVMAVNNETGVVANLSVVAHVVRELAPEAILHSDAVQAASWMDLRSITKITDSISLSAHKFGGPKGIGLLWLRDGKHVEPLMFGGGQERDRRSGTHNVAGIVGMAAALRETASELASEPSRIASLRDRLVDSVASQVGEITEVASRTSRIPGSAHICIGGVESEAILFLLDRAGVCASSASACASGAMEPSHVLAAMGVESSLARGALRMTLGHTTTESDVDRAVDVLVAGIKQLRRV